MLHWTAWERGMKSLYYCRSKSIKRAGFAGQLEKARAGRRSPQPPAPTMRSASHVSDIDLANVDPRTLIGKGKIGLLEFHRHL